MKKVVKKTKISRFERYKNSRFLSDRLTVWLCILLCFFTLGAMTVFAADDGSQDGKTVGDLGNIDRTITHFSELVAEGFGLARHSGAGKLPVVLRDISGYATVGTVGNLFGLSADDTMEQNNENAGHNNETGGSAPATVYGFGNFVEPYASKAQPNAIY